ncbi:MAG: hypothetical protein JF610_17775 [Acidobacteria bacterium]|nr:hypothetical protein [Acidobacteriota bacterium]
MPAQSFETHVHRPKMTIVGGDRIIRLEMRVRGMSLLTPEQQRMLGALTIKQIVALRFAPDAELPSLLERAVREQLSPADIKRAINEWVPDLHRT